MIVTPLCVFCRHAHRDRRPLDRCDAFPDGIPDAIYQDGFDHRRAYPGDHGIRYAALPEFENSFPTHLKTDEEATVAKAS